MCAAELRADASLFLPRGRTAKLKTTPWVAFLQKGSRVKVRKNLYGVQARLVGWSSHPLCCGLSECEGMLGDGLFIALMSDLPPPPHPPTPSYARACTHAHTRGHTMAESDPRLCCLEPRRHQQPRWEQTIKKKKKSYTVYFNWVRDPLIFSAAQEMEKSGLSSCCKRGFVCLWIILFLLMNCILSGVLEHVCRKSY